MRVISGKCRGTHLVAPDGVNTRPTTDRIKETLFNMIAFDIPECDFLDLFSGSGAIAIEALSRGANKAVLVEKDELALKAIRANLEKTKLKDQVRLYDCEIQSALRDIKHREEVFDIIFMDPPYALDVYDILQKIVDDGLLKKEGYIILERSSNSTVKYPENLVLWKEKNYKTTTMSFFKKG